MWIDLSPLVTTGNFKESPNHIVSVSFFFQGETLDDIPQTVIDDCAQLVKANSIQGNCT